jgi:saccharopine dehydrogenase-like NADP-dependent oxidoreductase
MAKIIVLGGCGTVGSFAVKTLAALEEFSEILIEDIDTKKTRQLISTIGSGT